MESQEFVFDLNAPMSRISDEEVLRAIAELGKTLGRRVLMREWQAWSGRPCCATSVLKRFGSWGAAQRRAGLDVADLMFTPEELMQKLEHAWRKLGRRPGATMLKRAAGVSNGPYIKRWGNLRSACERLAAHKRGDMSREELLRATVAKDATKRKVSAGTRFRVLERDGNKCQICGKGASDGAKLEVDHIVPLCKGGGNEMANLRALCSLCNRGKGRRLPREAPRLAA